MFIRIKKIKGIPYAYLVKNKWKKGKTIQKTVKYLGKVIEVNPNDSPNDDHSKLDEFSLDSQQDLFLYLIEGQLKTIGFEKEKTNFYINPDLNIRFNVRTLTFSQNGKNCVLRVNEGFLCNFNLKKLKQAIKDCLICREEDFYDYGRDLAKALVDLGFILTKDQFQEIILFLIRNRNERTKQYP